MDLLLGLAQVERQLNALMEVHLATLEHVCNAVTDVVDIIHFGADVTFWGGGADTRSVINNDTPEETINNIWYNI